MRTPHLPRPAQDDLVCLPGSVAKGLGNLGPLVLVTRVTNALTLTDPLTLRSAVVEAPAFWRAPYRALMSARQLTEFYVLDVEPAQGGSGCVWGWSPCCRGLLFVCVACHPLWGSATRRPAAAGGRSPCSLFSSPPCPSPPCTSPPFPPALPPAGAFNQDSRYGLAEAQVARAADFGSNDRTSFTRTHLGHLLHPGDTALGYDVANANLVDLELDKYLAAGKVRNMSGYSQICNSTL